MARTERYPRRFCIESESGYEGRFMGKCICTMACSNLEKQYLAKADGHTDTTLQSTRVPAFHLAFVSSKRHS